MRIGVSTAVAIVGVEGRPVRVEAVLLRGLPSFTVVGLPDAAVSESRERIRAAFASAGIDFPAMRLTVNLSPADLPKSGTGFDLGIAVAILGAMGGSLRDPRTLTIGELGLDGSIRRVRGILPAALAAAQGGLPLIVPWGCGPEAELAGGESTEVWDLAQVAHLMGVSAAAARPRPPRIPPEEKREEIVEDLADVRAQYEARYALEIAAAGGHHLLMTGAPGVGKSMLASRMAGILPDLAMSEALEVASVASAAGEFLGAVSLRPPFVHPHHTVSGVALVGGGSTPRPGAISRAHCGVLFLDEMPEFSPHSLQALREPMESGEVRIHRARQSVAFPARFQLVGAANPCKCGRFLDSPAQCTCSVRERRDYFRRIGGPILDRFDLSVVTPRLTRAELAMASPGESSAVVADRVREARDRQARRLADTPWRSNAQVSGSWLRSHTRVTLDRELSHGEISMRAADKALRVAWSIADLAGRDQPTEGDVHQAFALRRRDL